MPTHDFENIGDVLNFEILKGKITAIDSATDTCTVTVAGSSREALIFYHCNPDSIARDNGAIEGGAAGFKVDDEVVVLINSDKSVIKVIGHVDGIRPCWLVELISAGGSYSANYNISNLGITKVGLLNPYTHGYTVFDKYFTFKPESPFADITEESCVCVVPGAPINLVANVAADNVLGAAINHKDDWHYILFTWVPWPLWLIQLACQPTYEEDQMYHPGLSAAVYGGKVHWSHSPTTAGADGTRQHIIRYIDQEKRLYRPGRIDLKYDNNLDGTPVLNEDKTQKYLMTETGKITGPPVSYAMSVYGKKPFTRGSDGRVSSYNERMVVGSGSIWTMNEGYEGSLQGGGKIQFNSTMFFWPFIPYMWEIPNFNVFEYSNADPLYGRYMGPGVGSAYIRGWHLGYDTPPNDDPNDIPELADAAIFNGEAPLTSSVSAPRPVHIPYGGPQSASGSWVDTVSAPYKYTVNVEKSVPVGPVCNGKVLFVKNVINIIGTCEATIVTNSTKSSSFDLMFYSMVGFWPGWYGKDYGCGVDVSHTGRVYVNDYNVNGTVVSSLIFGDVVIDSHPGTMHYKGRRDKLITVDSSVDIHTTHLHELYPTIWAYDKIVSGTRVDTEKITGIMNRSLIIFAALDYDSESNFLYNEVNCAAVAVVYKKITISHNISRERHVDSTIDTKGYPISEIESIGAGFNGWPRNPGETFIGTPLPVIGGNTNPDGIVTADETTATGTRVVEYILYANVDGREYRKTLATFVGGIGSGSGQRCYGVVCKLQSGKLLVTYDLDNFVTPSSAQFNYDSPLNFEDWNKSLSGVNMWETSKRIVGIVDLSATDSFGNDLFDEQEPIPNEVYSISIKGK